jgi:hypothetical protein
MDKVRLDKKVVMLLQYPICIQVHGLTIVLTFLGILGPTVGWLDITFTSCPHSFSSLARRFVVTLGEGAPRPRVNVCV